MSFIDSLVSGGKDLSLEDIRNVQNWRERIPEIAESIASHPTLESVSVITNQDLDFFDAVIRNPHVKEIEFCDCELDSRLLLRVFREMTSLESLEFAMTRFTDVEAVVRVLQSNSKKLKELTCVAINDRVGDAVARAVAKSLRLRSSLKKLAFWACLTEVGLGAIGEALQGHTSLESVDLSVSAINLSKKAANTFALAIERNVSLTDFSLDARTIPVAGSLRLFQSLVLNTILQKVELKGVTFDIESPMRGTGVIRDNNSLKKLTIGASKGNEETSPAARRMIAPMLRFLDQFRSLSSLGLTNWEFDTEGIQAVCDKLRQNGNLENLGFTGSTFATETMDVLCHFLSRDASLIELDLNQIVMCNEGALALCKALRQNQTLKSVCLYANQMGDASIMLHLAELIESNDRLEQLSIADMLIIDEAGLVRLGKSLKKNTTLKSLVCFPHHGRPMSERGRQALLDGLKHHRKLHLLLLGNVPQSQKDEMKFYNERNKTLCPLLNAEPPLPLGLWPRVMRRASSCKTFPLDMLYFLVKEKSDLFRRSPNDGNHDGNPSSRKRKRSQGNCSGGRRKRGRSSGH